jgi:uncharacterized protein (TIGR01777 family)
VGATLQWRHRRPPTRIDGVKVAVTGASGFLGRPLVQRLRHGGHDVVRLVRRAASADDERRWDPSTRTLDPAVLEDVDAVVHLAGAGVADRRWTDARKEILRNSRVDGTAAVAHAVAASDRTRVLLSGSAVGYYGDTGDRLTDETGPNGEGFLARTCAQWEAATAPAEAAGRRVVHLRTGIVLGPGGGALGPQLPVFRAFLGAPLGSGRQWVPWISLQDHLEAVVHCLGTDVSGPVNLVAPQPIRNREFTKALGRAVHRPTLPVAVPGPVLRALLGEFAKQGVLIGQRLQPAVLQCTGFHWVHPQVDGALAAAVTPA